MRTRRGPRPRGRWPRLAGSAVLPRRGGEERARGLARSSGFACRPPPSSRAREDRHPRRNRSVVDGGRWRSCREPSSNPERAKGLQKPQVRCLPGTPMVNKTRDPLLRTADPDRVHGNRSKASVIPHFFVAAARSRSQARPKAAKASPLARRRVRRSSRSFTQASATRNAANRAPLVHRAPLARGRFRRPRDGRGASPRGRRSSETIQPHGATARYSNRGLTARDPPCRLRSASVSGLDRRVPVGLGTPVKPVRSGRKQR